MSYSPSGLFTYQRKPDFSTSPNTVMCQPLMLASSSDENSGLCSQKLCNRYAKQRNLCLVHYRVIYGEESYSNLMNSQRDAAQSTSQQYVPCIEPRLAVMPMPTNTNSIFSVLAESKNEIPNSNEQFDDSVKMKDKKVKLKNRNRKCRMEQCLSYARSGGYCTRHGGGRKCKVESCCTASQTGGYCRLHGGGSRCRVRDCTQFARIRGLCLQHNRGANLDTSQSPESSYGSDSPPLAITKQL